MDDYDGADAIEGAWRDGLKPDPLLTVSEWADRYRVLSQRASSEPGRWRTERTPYLREIMDCPVAVLARAARGFDEGCPDRRHRMRQLLDRIWAPARTNSRTVTVPTGAIVSSSS
jgi:hypothetical protein